MSKKTLRGNMIKTLREMDGESRKINEEILSNELFDFIINNNYKSVGMILSMSHEINTYPIIDRLIDAGVNVYGPACDYEVKEMHFYEMKGSELRTKDEKDIPIPSNLSQVHNNMELLIVPGLVFNDDGYRIGYGGGYYDKFLSSFKGDTAAIIFDIQLMNELPIEPHDIPVDVLITPTTKIQSKELRMNE